MDVATVVEIECLDRPEQVFDRALAVENLAKYFRGHGPIPAIEKAEVVGGGPLIAGATRRVSSSDGSVLEERMEVLERPTKQSYRIERGLKLPLKLIARSIFSQWTFSPSGSGTRIVWRFTVTLTTPLVYPAVALVMRPALERAMRECLERIRDDVAA